MEGMQTTLFTKIHVKKQGSLNGSFNTSS